MRDVPQQVASRLCTYDHTRAHYRQKYSRHLRRGQQVLYFTTTVSAQIHSQKLSSFLTSYKCENWKGTQTDFCNTWLENSRQYNDGCPTAQCKQEHLVQLLNAAVINVPSLSNVWMTLKQANQASGKGDPEFSGGRTSYRYSH